MRKLILILIILFVIGCSNVTNKLSGVNTQCCKECKDAFKQSPVDLGDKGAECGEFTTTQEISIVCKSYFNKNPTTVSECQ